MRQSPSLVKDVMEILKRIPEYQEGFEITMGPISCWGPKRGRAGKVFVDMTGGTGGSKEAFEKIARTEVGTIVGMHIGEEHRTEAEKNHLNVIIAGHVPSDSLGLNLLLDSLDQEGDRWISSLVPVSEDLPAGRACPGMIDLHSLRVLEFEAVQEMLVSQAASTPGQGAVQHLLPLTICANRAIAGGDRGNSACMIHSGGDPPLAGLMDIRPHLDRSTPWRVLSSLPSELKEVERSSRSLGN